MQRPETRISVIIPTLNRSNYLRTCIESLLHQSLDPKFYEIIITDNDSTDDTHKVVSSYLNQSKYNVFYILERRQGAHFARHSGARSANSQILAFIDDDVICDSRWLQSLLTAFEDTKIGCAGGKIIIKWDRAPPEWVIPYEPLLGKLDYGAQLRILEDNEYVNSGNLAIRQEVLWSVGGFNPDQIGEALTGDGEMGLCDKVRQTGTKIAWVPDAIVWHLQMTNKNATLLDLRRRFSNQGVSIAYSYYQKNHPTSLLLIRAAISSLCGSITCKIRSYFQKSGNLKKSYQNDLNSTLLRAEALYELKLAFSKQQREYAGTQNWID